MTSLSRRMLLATDGSEEAELAAGVAVEFAKSTGSEQHVVYVKLLPLTPPYPDVLGWREDLEWAEREAQELLDAQAKKVEDAGGTVAEVHLREELPAEIVALAEELGAYLIVVGNRGRGRIRKTLAGSVSDWVVRHAHCSVLVVRSPKSTDGRAQSLGSLLARFGRRRWLGSARRGPAPMKVGKGRRRSAWLRRQWGYTTEAAQSVTGPTFRWSPRCWCTTWWPGRATRGWRCYAYPYRGRARRCRCLPPGGPPVATYSPSRQAGGGT
jgi:nucleotide-binding universal stress UspA family protein